MTVLNAVACVDRSIKSFFYKSLTFYVYFLWEEKAIQSYFKYKKKDFSVFKTGSHLTHSSVLIEHLRGMQMSRKRVTLKWELLKNDPRMRE